MTITIFSLASCPHCKKAKALLADRGWPYVEISLSDYPERRADMLALADRLTVPQIFFGDTHVGGASELKQLSVDGGLERMYEAAGEPTDPRMRAPDYPPRHEEAIAPRTEESVCLGATCMSFQDVQQMLETELKITDRTSKLLFTHRQCFGGSELADLVQKRFELPSRAEAVQVCESLHGLRFFQHVTHEQPFVDDARTLYRLQQHAEPSVLNTRRIWADRVGDPMATLKALKKQLEALEEAHTDADGRVDAAAIAADGRFASFEEATCELQGEAMALARMEEPTRLAFCINLYNMAVRHAFFSLGTPTTGLQIRAYFDTVKYNVGGVVYSLNDLENGVLRCNERAPLHFSVPFRRGDPRLAACLRTKEPRIHFALNCGARSCPAVKLYTAEAVHEELRLAALGFLEAADNCRVERAAHTLWLSKIFSWYEKDFGESAAAIAAAVAEWLRGEPKAELQAMLAEAARGGHKVKVRHVRYDWSSNVKGAKQFTSRG